MISYAESNKEASMKPIESEEIKSMEIDEHLKYLHDSERDDKATWKLLQQAQRREDFNFKDECNHKYKLPETKVFHSFASNIYNNYQNVEENNIAFESDWRLLYRVQGKVLKKLFDGFFAELYFNTQNHLLLLVIKGTTLTSIGDLYSDIKNVYFGAKGEIFNLAFTFGQKVRVLMNEFKCKPMLLITGHSLGGYLAQIITYTITYCFVENGKVKSRKEPMDDFGIYTVVFDSPAAHKQISSMDPCDPIQLERFRLPIVNFIVDVNIINNNSKVGLHLGQVIAVKKFEDLNAPSKWQRIVNAKSVHGIKNFEDINLAECKQVEYLPDKKIVKYKEQEIQSCFFSAKNIERLHKYLILAAMCAELVEWLPSFKILNLHIILKDEKVSPQEFIPRAHRFLAKFKDDLDNGVFNGKNIIDNAIYNMWRAEMLKDANEFSLNTEWIERVQSWKDGTTIGGFESYEEMRFVGCMLHNSIPSYFHYDYEQYKSLDKKEVENFKATNTVTLILIVKNENQKIFHRAGKRVKIVYLLLNSNADKKVTMNLSVLDAERQEQLKNMQLQFMGNEVSVLDIFGIDLVEKLTIWNIFNFKKETVAKPNHFYSNQTVSGKLKRFESAIKFAQELMKKELRFVLISSDAGMGKSTALWQIALTLQQELPNNWIVHINLFDIQTELASAKDKLTSKEAAVEFVRNLELSERKNDKVLTKVFNCKLQEKKMIFLFDSLDEVCPYHREAVEKFIELLRETELQIVLTTRPHEGQNFKNADLFKLRPLDWKQIENFVDTKFKMLRKEPPSDIEEWLRKINFNSLSDNGFWSLPLNLNMATSNYKADADIAEPKEEKSYENIYEVFLTKSIENTIKIKFNLEKNEHQAASMLTYKNKVDKFNYLFENLAVCLIFHGGEIFNLEHLVMKEIIETSGEEINRFDVAKLDKNIKFVSFLHRSYAEYLVTKVFIKCHQKDLNCQAKILNDEQLKRIYFEKEFREIRKHVCQILAASPSVKMDLVPDFTESNKRNLLEVIIKEDCYELYLQINNQIKFHFKYSIFGFTYFNDFKPLYIALQKARKEFVQQLLKDGAKFEDISNETDVLHLAIQKGLNQEVKLHFKRLKSSMNKYEKGNFPLSHAAECANIDMVEFLIEKGAVVDKKINFDETALYYAIKANNIEVCELLIAKGADCTNALKWAADSSRMELFDLFYKNIPSECKEERIKEEHFEAARRGNLDIVKHICGFPELDPQALNSNGDTILHQAALFGQLHCMPFIFEYMNQSIDVRNQRGQTALIRALRRNKEEVVEWLLEQRADIHAVDDEGKSCLHYAVINENVNLVEMCLDAGADVNSQDNDGKTALYCASKHSRTKYVVNYLLENGANAEITDNDGSNCLHAACISRSRRRSKEYYKDPIKIVKLLVDLVPLNCTNDKGATPLHFAALEGSEEIVAFLLGEAKKGKLEPVDGEKIIRLTKKMHELEWGSKSREDLSNEIMKWQYIVKKCSS